MASLDRSYRGHPVIQAELAAAPGSSGGPVFNEAGEAIGVIMGMLPEQPWATIIIPIDNAYDMLERHGATIGSPAVDSTEPALLPAPGISEVEMRAVAAYNRGARAFSAEEKMEHYAEAANLLPAFYEAWFNLAVAATAVGQFERAFDGYRRAQQLQPDRIETWRNLGRLYLRSGDAAAAVLAFEQAVVLAPEAPQSYNDLGEAYRKAGEPAKAVEAFTRATTLDHNYANAYYNLAVVLTQEERWKEAQAALEQYLSIVPNAEDGEHVRSWMRAIASRSTP